MHLMSSLTNPGSYQEMNVCYQKAIFRPDGLVSFPFGYPEVRDAITANIELVNSV